MINERSKAFCIMCHCALFDFTDLCWFCIGSNPELKRDVRLRQVLTSVSLVERDGMLMGRLIEVHHLRIKHKVNQCVTFHWQHFVGQLRLLELEVVSLLQ